MFYITAAIFGTIIGLVIRGVLNEVEASHERTRSFIREFSAKEPDDPKFDAWLANIKNRRIR